MIRLHWEDGRTWGHDPDGKKQDRRENGSHLFCGSQENSEKKGCIFFLMLARSWFAFICSCRTFSRNWAEVRGDFWSTALISVGCMDICASSQSQISTVSPKIWDFQLWSPAGMGGRLRASWHFFLSLVTTEWLFQKFALVATQGSQGGYIHEDKLKGLSLPWVSVALLLDTLEVVWEKPILYFYL